MEILQFRPYKKLRKDQLITEIDRVRQHLNQMQEKDSEMLDYLNKLFSEAKMRELSLNEKEVSNRILYSETKTKDY